MRIPGRGVCKDLRKNVVAEVRDFSIAVPFILECIGFEAEGAAWYLRPWEIGGAELFPASRQTMPVRTDGDQRATLVNVMPRGRFLKAYKEFKRVVEQLPDGKTQDDTTSLAGRKASSDPYAELADEFDANWRVGGPGWADTPFGYVLFTETRRFKKKVERLAVMPLTRIETRFLMHAKVRTLIGSLAHIQSHSLFGMKRPNFSPLESEHLLLFLRAWRYGLKLKDKAKRPPDQRAIFFFQRMQQELRRATENYPASTCTLDYPLLRPASEAILEDGRGISLDAWELPKFSQKGSLMEEAAAWILLANEAATNDLQAWVDSCGSEVSLLTLRDSTDMGNSSEMRLLSAVAQVESKKQCNEKTRSSTFQSEHTFELLSGAANPRACGEWLSEDNDLNAQSSAAVNPGISMHGTSLTRRKRVRFREPDASAGALLSHQSTKNWRERMCRAIEEEEEVDHTPDLISETRKTRPHRRGVHLREEKDESVQDANDDSFAETTPLDCSRYKVKMREEAKRLRSLKEHRAGICLS